MPYMPFIILRRGVNKQQKRWLAQNLASPVPGSASPEFAAGPQNTRSFDQANIGVLRDLGVGAFDMTNFCV